MKRNGKKCDLDNTNLANLEAADEQLKLIHPDIISEIPGVKTEDMYDGIIKPVLVGQEEKPPSYAKRVAKARKKCRPIYYQSGPKSE